MTWFWWILFFIIWFIVVTAAYAGYSAAPWVPTKKEQRRLLFNFITLRDNSNIIDLGCGTGTIIFDSITANYTVNATGYEISFLPYLIAKLKSFFKKNVNIYFKNIYSVNLSHADIIFIFLTLKSYKKLINTLKTTKPDAKIIVEGWPIPKITPVKISKNKKLLPLYLYQGSQFHNL